MERKVSYIENVKANNVVEHHKILASIADTSKSAKVFNRFPSIIPKNV